MVDPVSNGRFLSALGVGSVALGKMVPCHKRTKTSESSNLIMWNSTREKPGFTQESCKLLATYKIEFRFKPASAGYHKDLRQSPKSLELQ